MFGGLALSCIHGVDGFYAYHKVSMANSSTGTQSVRLAIYLAGWPAGWMDAWMAVQCGMERSS